ncbi:MAG: Fur family transcriptional regulator [Acidobacteriota bacterium]|nr:Fur family transcriptional regulator [Acidobacteriota bacterium]
MKTVEKLAKEHGMKMTPQRRAIIMYLQSAKNHPTPEDILKVVNRRFPMASRATVYNTINWLKERGLLKEIFEGGIMRLDPNFHSHHHFICRKCGKVEDIEFEMVPDIDVTELSRIGAVENFELTFRGLCKNCQLK